MGPRARLSDAPVSKADMLERRERLLVAINQAELMGFEGTKEALIEILKLMDEQPIKYIDQAPGN